MKARALEADDLSALIDLRLEGIRQYPYAFLQTEEEARSASEEGLLGWIASGKVRGLFDGETLIGFAGLDQRPLTLARHRAHIGPFYVTSEHHGTGAAETLMQHLEDTARAAGVRQLELWVAAENTAAVHFYGKRGFRRMGSMPAAVMLEGRARDDIFMVRDLTADPPQPGPDGLRRLGPGDWRAFRDVRLEMLEKEPQSFGSPHASWAQKAPDEIMAWLDTIHLWAEMRGGHVLATAGWSAGFGEILSHRGTVIAVYTRPGARGRGLAKSVLAALEEDARIHGITQLELSVGTNNPAAGATYRACGYRVMGTIPDALNYPGNSVDQYEMVKPLVHRQVQ